MTNVTRATLTAIDFNTMSNKEMAQWFGITRFADRKTAVARCEARRAQLIADLPADTVTKTEAKQSRTAAEGIAASWKNPEVAAKRLTRNSVVVDGVEYKSVRAAFFALGLDDAKHIKFRMELKANGFGTFQDHKFVIAD
ncbi:hypothetical protein Gekk315_00080 [Aeromonas phage Gekk3-15]